MNEAETRADHIDPALKAAGFDALAQVAGDHVRTQEPRRRSRQSQSPRGSRRYNVLINHRWPTLRKS